MAEPSLLCVNCARPPPPHRRTWGRCTVCIARNLPSTYYCGEECMNAHWHNGHKEYHKEQKEHAKQFREGSQPEHTRSLAEAEAWFAERTGDEYDKRFAAALALNAEHHDAAAKAWRRLIKERPEEPGPYHNLANVMQRSGRHAEAAPLFLKAMELYPDGIDQWAAAAASAFDTLKSPTCREAPKPEWWNDEALKALSAQAVAVSPDGHMQCSMRARVLCGDALNKANWSVGPRAAAEIKEAATWYRRAAMLTRTPSSKPRYEEHASACDEHADPLLAEEKAVAAAARAAAEAESAEALEVAEAKAAAAAEELLAEEDKERQQAAMTVSTKAGKSKQGKGKKGKGKR